MVWSIWFTQLHIVGWVIFVVKYIVCMATDPWMNNYNKLFITSTLYTLTCIYIGGLLLGPDGLC